MKEITLHDAYYFLKQCTGVLLEGRYIEPHLLEIEDDCSNEWMYLQWEDEHEGEALSVVVSFVEEDNQKVCLNGSKLYLISTEGDEEELTLLREWAPEVK